MKRLLLLFLLIAPLGPITLVAGEKANTVLIHQGEVIYARFDQKGKKLKLVKASKEKDDQAQVILTLDRADPAQKGTPINLKIENRFTYDLDYQAEMRRLTRNMHMKAPGYPVVAGKICLVPFPANVEEIAVFEFELEL